MNNLLWGAMRGDTALTGKPLSDGQTLGQSRQSHVNESGTPFTVFSRETQLYTEQYHIWQGVIYITEDLSSEVNEEVFLSLYLAEKYSYTQQYHVLKGVRYRTEDLSSDVNDEAFPSLYLAEKHSYIHNSIMF